MPDKFSLSKKGMLIVLLPVLLSTALIASLKVVLEYTRAEARAEARSRAIAAAGQKMFDITFHGVVSFHLYQITGIEKFEIAGDNAVQKIHEQEALLRRLIPPGSSQASHLAAIEKHTADAIKMLKEPVEIFDDVKGGSLVPAMRRELYVSLHKVTKEVAALLDEESRNTEDIAARAEQYRKTMDSVLTGGVLLSFIVGFILSNVFSKQITGRLAVLTDNVSRLATNSALNKPVSGNDEITALDRSFHSMAQELIEARRKERAIMETMPVGVMTLKEDGTIEAVNSSALTLLRRESVDVINHNVSQFIRESKGSSAAVKFSEEVGKILECFVVSADGQYVPVETRTTKLDESEPLLLVSIADLTQRYEIEQMKQGFIAMISHELRSPLASITLCLNLLERGAYGTITESGLTSVSDSLIAANRIMSLVNEILDAERIQAGQLTVTMVKRNIKEPIHNAIRSLRALAAHKSITLEFDPLECELEIDAVRIEQVVLNFLSNAIKFSPPDSTVKILCSQSPVDVTVSVIDVGPGIPAEHQEDVFRRFFQLKSDSNVKGAGIGLWICKAIIDAHGGSIGVKNAEDAGSCFWFSLPRKSDLL